MLVVAAVAMAGCPRLPAPPPRPHAEVTSIERLPGALIELRIALVGADAFVVEAVDYQLMTRDHLIHRGRGSALVIVTDYAAELAHSIEAGGEIEVQGAVHLRRGQTTTMATFSSVHALR